MAKKLFAFQAVTGNKLVLTGLFISTEEEVTALVNSVVNFGEALGGGTEIQIAMKPEHFRVLEVRDDTIEDLAQEVGHTVSGYNPFDYVDVIPNEYDQDEQITLLR